MDQSIRLRLRLNADEWYPVFVQWPGRTTADQNYLALSQKYLNVSRPDSEALMVHGDNPNFLEDIFNTCFRSAEALRRS